MPIRNNDRVTSVDNLRIDFTLRGITGCIDVSISANTDPAALGYTILSKGLPEPSARAGKCGRSRWA